MPTRISRFVTGLVWAIAIGVAVQAVLAGQFISGVVNALPAHSTVANVLELAGVLLIISASFDRWTRRNHRRRWLAALLLGVAVIVQAGLGYAPFAVSTAIHVPLGVALLTWSVTAAVALMQAARDARAQGPADIAAGQHISASPPTGDRT